MYGTFQINMSLMTDSHCTLFTRDFTKSPIFVLHSTHYIYTAPISPVWNTKQKNIKKTIIQTDATIP